MRHLKRITDISQLKKGDMIFNVSGDVVTIFEFREIHPHNDAYSIMLNSNQDGAPKFYNKRLEEEEWYLYTDETPWDEIYQIVIDSLTTSIERYKEMMNKVN